MDEPPVECIGSTVIPSPNGYWGLEVGYRPPKGVKPPQLEGRRTGRPKGSRNLARAWRDCVWGFTFRDADGVKPPNAAAEMFRRFARWYPDEVEA
jgi:hypothetical protein